MPDDLRNTLAALFPQAKQATLRQMLRDGRVRVNGTVARRLDLPVTPADAVVVADLPRRPAPSPASVSPLTVVLEDPDFVVIDKPPGLLTSTVPNEQRPTAWAILERAYDRPGLIHRLDRDASGLLVFSRTPAAYDSLKGQFFQHTVERVYIAITHDAPTPADGRIATSVVELPDGSVRTTRKPGNGRPAVTDYRTIARGNRLAALRVQLQTGRKHQIRTHLSDRGVPLLGDRVYGRPDDAPRLMLAAVRLGFLHPRTGRPVLVTLPAPADFPLLAGQLIE